MEIFFFGGGGGGPFTAGTVGSGDGALFSRTSMVSGSMTTGWTSSTGDTDSLTIGSGESLTMRRDVGEVRSGSCARVVSLAGTLGRLDGDRGDVEGAVVERTGRGEEPPIPPLPVSTVASSGTQPPSAASPSDASFLRADIRRLAQSIVELNEAHPCDQQQLYLPIRGLKRRLDDHRRLTSMATAEPQEALQAELEVLEDEMLTKEREIVAFFRESQSLAPRSDFAARLRHMIWDLEDRLDLL